ncbi:hypothetical protein [Schleiferilactobacillus perolens]|uniref:hypothetical protein n=1 Tax=Schleiferilactobacillus perolens TaxID=100468 RepID=UPI0023542C77|nr:hypothetical protein [Schleiferilactobacillus perolens]MCI2170076.1 hypothetical protein [Schleiferilactobacillus perolens]
MGEKGSKQEWIEYFTVVNGRAPTEPEIAAARDIYDADGAEALNQPNVAGGPRVDTEEPLIRTASKAQSKPVDDIRRFFTQKQWRDKAAWQALVLPTQKLPTTMAAINILLGVLWLIVVVNLSSLMGNMQQLATQFSLVLQGSSRSSAPNSQEIQTMLAAVNNPLTMARIVTVLLTLVTIAVSINYLFQVVRVRKPLYWLVGADVVTSVAAFGGYMALQSALNTVVVSQYNYTLNNVLDMANTLMSGVGQSLTNSSGGILGALTSNNTFATFVQRYAAYLGGIIGSLHTVLTVLIFLGVISGVLAITGMYLFLKKKWGASDGQ